MQTTAYPRESPRHAPMRQVLRAPVVCAPGRHPLAAGLPTRWSGATTAVPDGLLRGTRRQFRQ
jgi:hypothetical protein